MKLLAVMAHPDDAEIWAGGTIAKHIQRGDFSGTYIHFGIREHAMGGIMNGLALHGLRPYGGTFLVFSDYMRPTIRLAAQDNRTSPSTAARDRGCRETPPRGHRKWG